MKTQVTMKRVLFNDEIRQQSKTGFFNANDLIQAGNKWRVSNNLPFFKLQDWLNRNTTKEFIASLEKEIGIKVKNAGRGRNASTWIHPFLFIDLALAISPKLKIEVYSWLYDELLKYRNNSGDSYRKMAGALYVKCKNKTKFSKLMIKTAEKIKKACEVEDWQEADENQLKLRDRIHENIALLTDVLRNNNHAIRIGVKKALDFKK